jgi:hypothetical protein
MSHTPWILGFIVLTCVVVAAGWRLWYGLCSVPLYEGSKIPPSAYCDEN